MIIYDCDGESYTWIPTPDIDPTDLERCPECGKRGKLWSYKDGLTVYRFVSCECQETGQYTYSVPLDDLVIEWNDMMIEQQRRMAA